jgi:hypothetical protein
LQWVLCWSFASGSGVIVLGRRWCKMFDEKNASIRGRGLWIG